MGLFKDLRALTAETKEMRRNLDPVARMRDAQAQMRGLQQSLATQTAAAALATSGEDAQAKVLATRDAGMHVNLQPLVEIDLLVQPTGRAPYPVTIRQVVPHALLGMLVAGSTLPVRIDPNSRETVILGC